MLAQHRRSVFRVTSIDTSHPASKPFLPCRRYAWGVMTPMAATVVPAPSRQRSPFSCDSVRRGDDSLEADVPFLIEHRELPFDGSDARHYTIHLSDELLFHIGVVRLFGR